MAAGEALSSESDHQNGKIKSRYLVIFARKGVGSYYTRVLVFGI